MNSHWSPFSSDSLIIIKFNPTKKKFASNMEGCDQPFEAILKTYISVPGSIRPSLFWIYTYIRRFAIYYCKDEIKSSFFCFEAVALVAVMVNVQPIASWFSNFLSAYSYSCLIVSLASWLQVHSLQIICYCMYML